VSVEVVRTDGHHPAAVALVAAMIAEVGRLYEPGMSAGPSATPEELSPPSGGFVLLVDGGRAVAGGGIKRIDAQVCEVKRMYVLPAARGRGLGARLLDELEALARDLGYGMARLDTGSEQPGAQRMYERAGYVAVPDYNGNPYASFWGEKALTAPAS
jgi:GNAT superfamily N-acetyltransferase